MLKNKKNPQTVHFRIKDSGGPPWACSPGRAPRLKSLRQRMEDRLTPPGEGIGRSRTPRGSGGETDRQTHRLTDSCSSQMRGDSARRSPTRGRDRGKDTHSLLQRFSQILKPAVRGHELLQLIDQRFRLQGIEAPLAPTLRCPNSARPHSSCPYSPCPHSLHSHSRCPHSACPHSPHPYSPLCVSTLPASPFPEPHSTCPCSMSLHSLHPHCMCPHSPHPQSLCLQGWLQDHVCSAFRGQTQGLESGPCWAWEP